MKQYNLKWWFCSEQRNLGHCCYTFSQDQIWTQFKKFLISMSLLISQLNDHSFWVWSIRWSVQFCLKQKYWYSFIGIKAQIKGIFTSNPKEKAEIHLVQTLKYWKNSKEKWDILFLFLLIFNTKLLPCGDIWYQGFSNKQT